MVLMEHRRDRLGLSRYEIALTLEEGSDTVCGEIEIRFEHRGAPAAPLPLDFDGEALEDATLNGAPLAPEFHANHILLPASRLNEGANTFTGRFRSRVAPTGTPLTVYRDPKSGESFYYTLLVPADAHRLFPCFDQPSLRGVFRLRLAVPAGYAVPANAPLESRTEGGDGSAIHVFEPTAPLPTYLFAFAAGPFRIAGEPDGSRGDAARNLPAMRIYHRPSQARWIEEGEIFRLHRQSVHALEEYFDYPYPFGKLDIVLCPGFPYGGMEHAGAIFYRETALVFDHAPTEAEAFARAYLIAHEVSHQWFGNLATMRWFDDLWLKEGFATFIGYRMLERIMPDYEPWLRFHQRIKPAALRVDIADGTTPVYQPLANLADAKSAYGPVVYNKAPAVLRELDHRLGEPAFREGVRRFLARHQFASATWRDLIHALEQSSGRSLRTWSDRWLLSPGVPRLLARPAPGDDPRGAGILVHQSGPPGAPPWPVRIQLAVAEADGAWSFHTVDLDAGEAFIDRRGAAGPPSLLLPNADDVAYAHTLLDDAGVQAVLGRRVSANTPLLREAIETALFNTLRDGRVHPLEYLRHGTLRIGEIDDLTSFQIQIGRLGWTLRSLVPDSRRGPARNDLAAALRAIASFRDGTPFGLEAVRALAKLAVSREDLLFLRERALRDPEEEGGLGRQDRFAIATALIAAGMPEGGELSEELSRTDEDVGRELAIARAAIPDAKSKEAAFRSFMNPTTPPEQWIVASLGAFHWPGHEALALPYLRPALDALEWTKVHRRIFFMPAWIEGFVGGHASREALETVEGFLADTPGLPPDIAKKLALPLYDLRLAVRLKEQWFPEDP